METKKHFLNGVYIVFCLTLAFLCFPVLKYTTAQTTSTEASPEINNLTQEINQQKAKAQEVEDKRKALEAQLNIVQRETYTINSQLSTLNNQIQDTEYEIEKKVIELDQHRLEIERLGKLIEIKEQEVGEAKIRLASFVRLIDERDRESTLYTFLARDTFSSYLDDVRSAADLQVKVQSEVKDLKQIKEDLDSQKAEQEQKAKELEEAQDALKRNQETLAQQKEYQAQRLNESKQLEVPYQVLIDQASKEQAVIDSQISSLESEALSKLLSLNNGLVSDKNVRLSWPISSLDKPGISKQGCISDWSICSAIYGFDSERYFSGVFHYGIDIPVPQGTAVYAPADGFVAFQFNPGSVCPYAWYNCSGYESRLILQHLDENGVATDMYTIYYHLSVATVQYSDDVTFVKKGDLIGRVGGAPGTRGAGFSSGPHLHFSVSIGGLPRLRGQYVNPLNYLP
ncbi:MAG: peptidoglycan DD-metalloendopeptidase family protein [Patescibacteria group bacterium]|jgi:murein DD-endopeptidase MepM/ murein hydrolase activator NlpD